MRFPLILVGLVCAQVGLVCAQVLAAAPALEVKVQKNVAVPMRDGTILRADVYTPKTGGPYPVLVSRSPYGKPGGGMTYAKAGYIVVCQVTRGRYESDGVFKSFVHQDDGQAEDGYDTVEWAAKLPGSNGKVGTFGASYNAYVQWKLASLRPPSLVVMSAHSIPARMTELEGPGGIRPGRRINWWYRSMSWDMRKRTDGEKPHSRAEANKLWVTGKDKELMYTLPWVDLPDSVFGYEAKVVKDWLRNPRRDPWQLPEICTEVAVPNFDVVGWFDHCNGSIGLHRKLVKKGRNENVRNRQRLVIGPWSHTGRGGRKVGDLDFGKNAAFSVRGQELRWFDHWLKGKGNGIDQEPPVRIFVMGRNEWRSEKEWPLSRAKKVRYFLDSGGSANTPAGDGRLGRKSAKQKGSDNYDYDPAKPVPTIWTAKQFTVPADQRPLAKRQDILVYQTEALKQEMEVTGYPKVMLYASSSARDTDFFVRLIDVAPDGVARDVTMGMVRASKRNGLEKDHWLQPGKVTKFEIEMNPTSNLFKKGHRIRLDVTSSDFPNFDRHHNTAVNQNVDARLVVATQTVHHGPKFRSAIELPVIQE